jgi:hypothetical protein
VFADAYFGVGKCGFLVVDPRCHRWHKKGDFGAVFFVLVAPVVPVVLFDPVPP